ncbi:hypothetical protein UFRH5_47 [Pseudomonas phage UF_RH5]|nr:hypothetical protein UFRH5_47 [Pseudomonas phage UF_RH5]
MATKNSTAKKNTAAPVIGLAEIVAAGPNGLYTSPAVHGPLVEAGMVEINPAMTNEAGEIATRATQKGIEEMNQNTETGTAAASAPVATSFTIEDNVPMPTGSGRGRGGNVYPFDALEVGQSFFVPNSEEKPNAAKSLASTVSSATARFAVPSEDGATKTNKKGETVPVMVETRKFVVRAVEGGARVWRTK